MSKRDLFTRALLVATLVAAVGCSGSNDNQQTSTPSTAGPGTTSTATTGGDELADAKTAVVEFFEAKAVNDYDKALSRASGSAAITVNWARDVNSVQAVANTPYAVMTYPAPNVRVQIDSLKPFGTKQWTATGFIELGFRPSGVASTTTTAVTTPGGSAVAAPSTVFITDMSFTQDGSRMKLDDFRLDDTAYPISQLYMNYRDAPATTTGSTGTTRGGTTGTTTGAGGPTAELQLGHRDMDGSVQYDVTFGGANGIKPAKATYFAGATTPPPTDATGSATDVLADPVQGSGSNHGLAVRLGAFPGDPGILRLIFSDSTNAVVGHVDLTVPPFPPLEARPVNTVRDRISSTTSSSSSSSSSSTSSAPSTSTVPSSSTVTVTQTITVTVPASSTTSTTRPSTTSSSTTSSTTTTHSLVATG